MSVVKFSGAAQGANSVTLTMIDHDKTFQATIVDGLWTPHVLLSAEIPTLAIAFQRIKSSTIRVR